MHAKVVVEFDREGDLSAMTRLVKELRVHAERILWLR
ncbi:hypothetical protein dqs_3862 [Azoarcus olearius]|nr:hypothetical protein dqs_3862 [Azoarcus olearius]